MQELARPMLVQQARGGHEEAVHAGQDARRDGWRIMPPEASKTVLTSAGSPRVVLAETGRCESGHGNQDQGIHSVAPHMMEFSIRRRDFFRREVEFFSGLGNGIEADEQPGVIATMEK